MRTELGYGEIEGSGDKDIAAQLIRTAGRREQPPVEAYERALRAATAVWESKVRGRRRVRLAGWIAAGIAAASAATWYGVRHDAQPGFEVGHIERLAGNVEWRPDSSSQWSALSGKPALTNGAIVRTGEGKAAIAMASGVSVRLAASTEVSLDSVSQVRVRFGQAYFDTGARATGTRRIDVVTDAGTAWDVGTQFEVLYRDRTYRLRVREGRVVLQRGRHELDNVAGEELVVTPAGEFKRSRIDIAGAQWLWAQSLALAPAIDGQPLAVLLDWVARETGRTVRYVSDDVRGAAARTILHGSVRDLAPLDALAAVLSTTDFEYSLQGDGTILIGAKRAH